MAIKFSEMKELLKDTDIQTIKLSDPVYNSCMRQLTQNIVHDNPGASKISFDILNKMKLQNKLSMVQFTYFDFIEFECYGFDIVENNKNVEDMAIKFAHGENVFGSISSGIETLKNFNKRFNEYNPLLFINAQDDLGLSYIYVANDLVTIDELKPISVHKQKIKDIVLKYIHFPYMPAYKFFSKNIIFTYNTKDPISVVCFCKKPTDSTHNLSKSSIEISFKFDDVMKYNVVHNYGNVAIFNEILEIEENDRIQILDETLKFI